MIWEGAGAGTISGFAPSRQVLVLQDIFRRGGASARAVSSLGPCHQTTRAAIRHMADAASNQHRGVGCEGAARKTPSSSRRTPGPKPRCSINKAPAAEIGKLAPVAMDPCVRRDDGGFCGDGLRQQRHVSKALRISAVVPAVSRDPYRVMPDVGKMLVALL